jgi:hypothetical protein
MKKNLENNNKNKKIISGPLPEADNRNLKKLYNKLPDAVLSYNRIVEKRKKRTNLFKNFLVLMVSISILSITGISVYSVENAKYWDNILRISNEKVALQKLVTLEHIKSSISEKNNQSGAIIEFNDNYASIRKAYYESIKSVSIMADNKVSSLEDLIKITEDRIKLTEDYKKKLERLAIPPQLAEFIKLESGFADSDITLWKIVNAYYSLSDQSTYDTARIYDEGIKSHELFLKAQEELKKVYTDNGLNYFLKDIIINY